MPGSARRSTTSTTRRSRRARWCACRSAGARWPGWCGRRRTAAPQADAALRPIAQVLDAMPPLGPAWMALVEFAAGYYQRALGELALGVLPPELRRLDAAQLAQRLQRARRAAQADAQTTRPTAAADADRRAGDGGGRDRPQRVAGARRAAAAARRDRQRQDRGLPARRRARAGARPPGAGDGARDQPHAAAAGARGASGFRRAAWSRCTAR